MSNRGFDGKRHEMVAMVVLSAVSLAVLAVIVFTAPDAPTWLYEACVGALLGAICGYWLTPDIDHDWKTMEEYRAERVLGWVGKLWNLAWRPYSLIFKHRSPWTHSWRGTLLRAVPCMLVIVAAYLGLRSLLGLDVRLVSPFYLTFIGAWMLQDAGHYLLDGLGPWGVGDEN